MHLLISLFWIGLLITLALAAFQFGLTIFLALMAGIFGAVGYAIGYVYEHLFKRNKEN